MSGTRQRLEEEVEEDTVLPDALTTVAEGPRVWLPITKIAKKVPSTQGWLLPDFVLSSPTQGGR